jgi:hypothetical protein
MSVAALGVTAALGVGSAAVGMYSASQAAKGQQASANAMRRNMPKFQPIEGGFKPERLDNVKYNEREAAALANRMTRQQNRMRERIMPGSAEQFRLGSNVLQAYLRGEVPQDVVEQTQRTSAERFGGTYDPNRPGSGQMQNDFRRSLGLQSLALQGVGLATSPTWQQLAQSFIVSPLQTSQLLYQYDVLNTDINRFNAAQKFSYDQLNTDINKFNSSQGYNAGYNDAVVAANQAAAGPMGNALMGQVGASALGGLANAAADIYGGYTSGRGVMPPTTTVAQALPVGGAAAPFQNYGFRQVNPNRSIASQLPSPY